MKGLFQQRCGCAKTKDLTHWTDDACHTKVYRGVNPPEEWEYGERFTDKDGKRLKTTHFAVNNWQARRITKEPGAMEELSLPGGWHDAADFDRRPMHMRIVGDLALMYMARPENFTDGYGLMPHLDISIRSADNDYYAVRNYLRDKHPALFRGWFDFPYELTDDILERIEGLRKFRLKKHRHYNLPNERIRVLSGFLQKRASDICSYKKETDKKCEQSLALESLNSNENVGVKSLDKSGLNASEQKAAARPSITASSRSTRRSA